MPSDTANTPPPVDTYPDDSESGVGSSTAMNALVGAAIGIVLSFLPGSTFLGGAVAGYLEGGDVQDALRVGALAGLVMLVPLAFFGLFAATLFLGVGVPGLMGGLLVVALGFGVLYAFGLSIVGAVVGREFEREL